MFPGCIVTVMRSTFRRRTNLLSALITCPFSYRIRSAQSSYYPLLLKPIIHFLPKCDIHAGIAVLAFLESWMKLRDNPIINKYPLEGQ